MRLVREEGVACWMQTMPCTINSRKAVSGDVSTYAHAKLRPIQQSAGPCMCQLDLEHMMPGNMSRSGCFQCMTHDAWKHVTWCH